MKKTLHFSRHTLSLKSFILALLMSLGYIISSHAQEESLIIKGIVTDSSGMPVADANVSLKNSETGTITNFDGEFEFLEAVPSGATLIVSYLGFEAKEVYVKESYLTIALEDAANALGTVNIIGAPATRGVYTSSTSKL